MPVTGSNVDPPPRLVATEARPVLSWLPFTASVDVAVSEPAARLTILLPPTSSVLPGASVMPAASSVGPPVTATLVRPVRTGLTATAMLPPVCVVMMLLPAVIVAVLPGAMFCTEAPLATPVPVAAVVTFTPAPAAWMAAVTFV